MIFLDFFFFLSFAAFPLCLREGGSDVPFQSFAARQWYFLAIHFSISFVKLFSFNNYLLFFVCLFKNTIMLIAHFGCVSESGAVSVYVCVNMLVDRVLHVLECWNTFLSLSLSHALRYKLRVVVHPKRNVACGSTR